MVLSKLCLIPFGNDQIAIAVSHSAFGAGHIGIAFHSVKEGPQVLHLAWHLKQYVDSIPAGLSACWGAFPLLLPPAASKQVVAFVRAVAKRDPPIGYGINFITSKNSFSANGRYIPPKGSNGLTCASFVIEVLRGAMINLVDLASWRSDPLNVEWGDKVCLELSKSAELAHVEAVKRDVSGLRLRPTEVAGAATLDRKLWPANFDAVQAPAEDVATALVALCPPIRQL